MDKETHTEFCFENLLETGK